MASRRGPDLTAKAVISGHYGNASWANIFWVQLATGSTITQADFDTWLNSFQAAYKTAFAPIQIAACTYSSAQAVLFQPALGELLSTVNMTGTGSHSTSDPMPANCAVCLSWVANVYWRGGKPRTYSVGVDATMVSGDTKLAAAAITAAQTTASGFRTAVNALTATSITGTQLGFVSFRSGNAERVPPVFYPFTGSRVHSRLASQRRRLGPWTP